MESIRLTKHHSKIAFLFIVLVLIGCGFFAEDSNLAPLTSTSKKIYKNHNPHFLEEFGVLSIATGNFIKKEFIDEWGKKRNEETAVLWVSTFGRPGPFRRFTAYAGQSIFYYSYKIQILRLGVDTGGAFMEIDVANAKTSDSLQILVLPENETVDYKGEFGILHLLTDAYQEDYLEGYDVPIPTANAVLKLWMDDKPQESALEKIHIGQTLLYEGYRVHITRIDSGSSGWFTIIELGLAEASEGL